MEYVLWTLYIVGALVATVIAAIYFLFNSKVKTVAGLSIRAIGIGVFWLPLLLIKIGQAIYKRSLK